MKQVLVIRHAPHSYDELTGAGVEACRRLAEQIGEFDEVYASPAGRAIQTAQWLTGREPVPIIAAASGQKLAAFIHSLLHQLGDGQQALIVSHFGTMSVAEQLLLNAPEAQFGTAYTELTGYWVDNALNIVKFMPV